MLGEEDIKKQQLNNEIDTKINEIKPESSSVSNAFTLDDIKLETLAKELDPNMQDYERFSHQINEIVNYVKNVTGAKEWNDVLWEVRLLSKELGNDALGQSQLQRLFRYVYLKNEQSRINRELKKENYVRI